MVYLKINTLRYSLTCVVKLYKTRVIMSINSRLSYSVQKTRGMHAIQQFRATAAAA